MLQVLHLDVSKVDRCCTCCNVRKKRRGHEWSPRAVAAWAPHVHVKPRRRQGRAGFFVRAWVWIAGASAGTAARTSGRGPRAGRLGGSCWNRVFQQVGRYHLHPAGAPCGGFRLVNTRKARVSLIHSPTSFSHIYGSPFYRAPSPRKPSLHKCPVTVARYP
jgi:hypothetical protein